MPPASGYPTRLRRLSGPDRLLLLLSSQARHAAQMLGEGVSASLLPRLVQGTLAQIDFSTDLGADIGSGRWWRGFSLMLSLSGAAIAFWPSLTLHPAKPAAHMALATSAPSVTATPTLAPSGPARDQIALVTTLADGDSFAQMLQRVGVGGQDAEQVAALMAAAIPMGEIAPGTSFSLSLDATGSHTLQHVDFRTRSDLAVAIERRGDSLELSTQGTIAPQAPLPTLAQPAAPIQAPLAHMALPAPQADATPLRIRGKVGASLYGSARAAGVPAHAIQQYLQTLGGHMDITSLRPDDTFDLIFGTSAGDLLYAGLEHDGHPRAQLLRWGKGGQFFDASLKSVAQPVHLLMPVAGKITSGFGMRFHPILGFTRMHEGVDLSAPWGSPIYAVASGEVAYAGVHGGHGNYVRLEHSGGLGTGYAHMSRIAGASGTHVRAGQVIGYVGSSGLSTGAHLHYEVYRNGETVNPLSVHFAPGSGAKLPGNLAAFRTQLAKMLTVKPGAVFGSTGSHVASR